MTQSQRILAAIIFTDVVGYSIRVQHEEEKTIALVNRDLAHFSSLCAANSGKVVKNTGDGLLIYFTSLDSAVKTATAMLQSLETGAKSLPVDQRLQHRIGIHLGDVVFQGEDVMGEGVNIAARLMAEALPDTLCISQSGFDIIKNRTSLNHTFIGPRQLKNIKDPVPAVLLHCAPSLPAAAPIPAPAQAAPQTATHAPALPAGRKPASKAELLAIIFFPIILLGGLGIYFFFSLPPAAKSKTTPTTPTVSPVPLTPPAPAFKLDPNKPFAKANLLDLIDPSRDTVLGDWKWSNTGLTVAMADPSGENTPPESLARIAIPVPQNQLPPEYDMIVSFTRNSGSKPITLIFSQGQNQAALEMGAWTRENDVYKEWVWINAINKRSLPDSPSRSSFKIETSRKYTALLKVRKDKIILTLDGGEVFRSQLDPTDLSNPAWSLPATSGLGIGACRGSITFHSIELQAAKPEIP